MPPPPPPPPPSSAAQAPAELANVESEFVVILAALLCALICILGLFTVARCTLFRRNTPAASSSAASNKGLKKKTLRSLPKFTYAASADSSKQQGDGNVGVTDDDDSNENNECAICLAEFVDGDEIRALPQCGHGFHVTCVDTWLVKHSSCPKCRRVLVVGKKCRWCGTATTEEVKRTSDPSTSTGISGADFLP